MGGFSTPVCLENRDACRSTASVPAAADSRFCEQDVSSAVIHKMDRSPKNFPGFFRMVMIPACVQFAWLVVIALLQDKAKFSIVRESPVKTLSDRLIGVHFADRERKNGRYFQLTVLFKML